MRGFPLVNTLFVLAIFVIAWWPLRMLTEARPDGGDGAADADQAQADVRATGTRATPLTMKFSTTHELESLTVEHLGRPLIVLKGDDLRESHEHRLEGIEVPAEGIEFWIEATFSGEQPELQETHRQALGIEIVPDDLDREELFVTLWSRPGERSITDLATFMWTQTDPTPD